MDEPCQSSAFVRDALCIGSSLKTMSGIHDQLGLSNGGKLLKGGAKSNAPYWHSLLSFELYSSHAFICNLKPAVPHVFGSAQLAAFTVL